MCCILIRLVCGSLGGGMRWRLWGWMGVEAVSGGGQFDDVEAAPVLLGVPKVKLQLLIEPAFRAGIEGDGEADSHLRADACVSVQYGGNSLAAHAKRSRGLGDIQIQGLQAERFKYFTGMGRIVHFHSCFSDSLRSLRCPRLWRPSGM